MPEGCGRLSRVRFLASATRSVMAEVKYGLQIDKDELREAVGRRGICRSAPPQGRPLYDLIGGRNCVIVAWDRTGDYPTFHRGALDQPMQADP
jgi:hypothetical protein